MPDKGKDKESTARRPSVLRVGDEDMVVDEVLYGGGDNTNVDPPRSFLSRQLGTIRRRSSAHSTGGGRPASAVGLRLTAANDSTNLASDSKNVLQELDTPFDDDLSVKTSFFGNGATDGDSVKSKTISIATGVHEGAYIDDGEGVSSSSSSTTRVHPMNIEDGTGTPDDKEWADGATTKFFENKGKLFKIAFVATACSAQLIAQGQFGMVLIPMYQIAAWLGTSDQGQIGWMTAANGLTVGMFLVPAGRLGDLFGPRRMWILGSLLVIISNLACGFCRSPIPFDVCRAIGGIGSAFIVPSALAMLGRTYPPGTVRILVFAILGALAPVGFVVPGTIAAVIADAGKVEWIWWLTALFTTFFLGVGLVVLPPDSGIVPWSKQPAFDYLGTFLLLAGLGLFNFTWNQVPLVKWAHPSLGVCLGLSIICFIAFFWWEKRFGRHALIPIEVLTKTSMMVYLSLWLGWISFGVFFFYNALFIHNIKGKHTALGVAGEMAPFGPSGMIAALIVPLLITRLPGHVILIAAMVAFFFGALMAALTPPDGSYWAWTFPAMVVVVFGSDMSFSTGQLIVSNSVPREFQGIAAGIVSLITNYSMSVGLGIAGTIELYVAPDGPLLKGYRAAFYLSAALGFTALVVVGLFVRMPVLSHH